MATIWPLLLCLGAAPAPAQERAPLDVATVTDWTRSVAPIHLAEGPPVWLHEPLVFDEGPVSVRLDGGYLAPVVSGHSPDRWAGLEGEDEFVAEGSRGPEEVVGFVWVDGQGSLETRFPEQADAQRFANRMVRVGDYPREEFAHIATGAPFRTTISRGVVLGRVAELRPLVEARQAEDADETITVVADRRSAAQARRDAEKLLSERLTVYDDARWRVKSWIAIDRLESEVYGIGELGAHLVLDFRTGHRFPVDVAVVRNMEVGDREEERGSQRRASREWLTAVRDDNGGFDSRLRTSVVTLYRHATDDRDDDDEIRRSWEVARLHVAGEPFDPIVPDDPRSAPAAPRRMEAVAADSRLWVRPRKGDSQVLEVDVQGELTLRSVGSTAVFALVLPRGRQRAGLDAMVEALLPDGTDVLLREPTWDESQVWVALPEPLTDGEELELLLRHKAYWTVGHHAETEGGPVSLGTATGPREFLPTLGGGVLGNAWRFKVTVGVEGLPRMMAAASGEHLDAYTKGEVSWLEAVHEHTPVLWPMVAVGRWHTHQEEPYKDLPGVKVHLLEGRDSVLESFPPEVRRVGVFMDRFLPTFPAPEVDVVEDAGSLDGMSGLAPYGMAAVSRFVSMGGHGGLRDNHPHLENGLLAHELAHQYWGHMVRPPHGHDFWVAESMAEVFARMYLIAAFGPKDNDERSKYSRRVWEKDLEGLDVPASLTRADDSPYRDEIVYQYGTYVMFEMLRPRIGDTAFYNGLNKIFEDHAHEYITTARLQASLEAACGRSLADFFRYWVEVGQIPRVHLEWVPIKQGNMVMVKGHVTTDVPFGTFDLPIQVVDNAGMSDVYWVEVVDGVGHLETKSVPGSSVRVKVDPEHLVLARSRKARKVKELSASGE